MQNYELPYLGEINLNELADNYQTTIDLNGENLRIDINFGNKTITFENFTIIKFFLQNINRFDKRNLKIIEVDFNKLGETSDYIEFYLNELDETELSTIIDLDKISVSKEMQLLNKLKLIRVGLYPDGKYGTNYFGVFDYSIDIDEKPCNQLLVVKTNEKGELDHITWES